MIAILLALALVLGGPSMGGAGGDVPTAAATLAGGAAFCVSCRKGIAGAPAPRPAAPPRTAAPRRPRWLDVLAFGLPPVRGPDRAGLRTAPR
jgi:hypothetical protein